MTKEEYAIIERLTAIDVVLDNQIVEQKTDLYGKRSGEFIGSHSTRKSILTTEEFLSLMKEKVNIVVGLYADGFIDIDEFKRFYLSDGNYRVKLTK